jgi:DNA modification methylase
MTKPDPAVVAPGTVSDLKPDPANRRAHNPRNLDMLAESLREVGAARSIVIDEDDLVLAGNGVRAAAEAAGITKLRVIETDGDEIIAVRRRGLTARQKRALAIYDNRTAELAAWNWDQFAKDRDLGLSLQPFFTAEEEAEHFERAPDERDGDILPEMRPTSIKRGDCFALGRHRLLCGDCTVVDEVARLLDGATADCCATDPPYCSGGFQETGKAAGSVGRIAVHKQIVNDRLSTRGYQALLKQAFTNSGAPYLFAFTDWRMWIWLFDIVESCGYGVRSMIVWDKGTPGMGRGWRSQHELIMWGAKDTPPFDKHASSSGNVLNDKRTGNIHHTTEKPVGLMTALLANVPFAERVIDPFCGSGTTLIACERLGRIGYAAELDPSYCQVTIDRWELFTGAQATKV